jgi:DNA mismatch endonuclease, patch repair protein
MHEQRHYRRVEGIFLKMISSKAALRRGRGRGDARLAGEEGTVGVAITQVRPSSPGVSARMSKHPRRDTGPEIELRRLLYAAGLRYRVQYPVPGRGRRTIDIAFTRRKVAIFVDGCFWHGCAEHRTVPTSNHDWWEQKLMKNARRDAETDDYLQRLGWQVVRLWEHERAADAYDRVRQALDKPSQ